MGIERDLQTWREEPILVPAKSLVAFDFVDTNPNYFFIVNGGNTSCFFGIKSMPTASRFDLEIPAHSTRVLNQFHGARKVYFYNDGVDEIQLILKSFQWVFDPSILAVTQSGGTGSGSGGGSFDGIIRGFNVPLPSGGNKIGEVSLTGAIPSGANTIGKVEIVGNVSTAKMSGTISHGNATSTATLIFASADALSFFSNDGAESIFIGKSAGSVTLEIKGGEVLSDVPWVGPLYAVTSANPVPYRAIAGA